MFFRKRGVYCKQKTGHMTAKSCDVVNEFNYLGTVFNYTGNISLNQEHLLGKALKALNVLFYNCKKKFRNKNLSVSYLMPLLVLF